MRAAGFDEPTRQERCRLTVAPQDQVMKVKAVLRMVAEKAQVVEQCPVGGSSEECLPYVFVAIERRNGDRLCGTHFHLVVARQRAFTSPTVAVGNPRVLTVASRSISRERAPFPECLAAKSRTGSW